ncbi:molecular chaperone DnaJ [bacterium]|nr:molecular chaperone DnaJ [bacterium]
MIKMDYYEVLGLEKSVSPAEIKKAYRQAAIKYHPDKNPGDHEAEEKFKEASEAYQVLSDSQKRQLYDAYGHQGLEGAGFHGFTGVDDIFASFGDIFEDFFGNFGFNTGSRTRRSRARGGADLKEELVITFEESAKGCEKEFEIFKHVKCEHCEGAGAEAGTGYKSCGACGGAGQVTARQGFFVMQTTCPKCHGMGQTLEKPCKECRGSGRSQKKKKLKTKIPAGIEDGMRMVLRGEGDTGEAGGHPGDFYIFVHVKPDDFFERRGEDVYCRVTIAFPEAALGTKIDVKTLDGVEQVQVPEGTQSGDELKLKGKGFINLHNKRKGDQIVEIFVKTPKKLSKKQKQLLKEFMEL